MTYCPIRRALQPGSPGPSAWHFRQPTALVALAGTIIWIAAPRAGAQTLDQVLPPDVAGVAAEPSVTVLSRARPGYESLGIRLGTVMINPTLTQGAGYESNVVGNTAPRGGPVVTTSGSVIASTQHSRADAVAGLTVDDVRYPDQPTQSHTDWAARLDGNLRLGRDVLSASFAHLNLNQTVRDLDVGSGLNQALAYRVDDGRIGYRANFARSFVVPAIEVTSYAYDNGRVGNAVYVQDYRDRLVVQPSVTLGYELATRRNAIVVLRNASGFYSTRSAGMSSRQYNDTAVLGGLDYDLDGLIRFRVLAGYETRSFQSAQYKTIQAPVTEATVIWSPTGLTTMTIKAARRIQDSADQTSASVTETNLRLQVDHELRANLLLKAIAEATLTDYSGGSNQQLYRAGVSATYLVNRKLDVIPSYDFYARRTNSDAGVSVGSSGQPFGPRYNDNLFLLKLRFRL